MVTLAVWTDEAALFSQLEDISGPPCEMGTVYGTRECGMPSVARVRVTCSGCGGTDHLFVCKHCLELLECNETECSECFAPVASWGVT